MARLTTIAVNAETIKVTKTSLDRKRTYRQEFQELVNSDATKRICIFLCVSNIPESNQWYNQFVLSAQFVSKAGYISQQNTYSHLCLKNSALKLRQLSHHKAFWYEFTPSILFSACIESRPHMNGMRAKKKLKSRIANIPRVFRQPRCGSSCMLPAW